LFLDSFWFQKPQNAKPETFQGILKNTQAMRYIAIILIFRLLTSFNAGQKKTITEFAQTQLDRFKIEQTFKTGYFVNSIENQNLHIKKSEIALKSIALHSNKNSSDKKVYTRIQLWQFDFETNDKCKRATDSLLNCFPNDCFKIKGQIDQGIKITPSIWIITDKNIYVAKTACEQVDEKWTNFIKDFSESFADDDSEIIVAECGKLKWTTIDKMKNAP
jgi:hypothetical protein